MINGGFADFVLVTCSNSIYPSNGLLQCKYDLRLYEFGCMTNLLVMQS